MSHLLSSGSSRVNNTSPPATSLRVQTALAGKAIPIGVGQQRASINLIEYVDFTSTPDNSSGSTGGKGIGGGSGGKGGSSSGSYNYSVFIIGAVSAGPVVSFVQAWNNQTAQTLGSLGLTGVGGDYTQTAAGYMASLHPDQAVAYRGVSYVAGTMQLGSSPNLPNITIETLFANNTAIPGQPDGDPALWMEELLTNADHGVGYPAARLGNLTTYSNFCKASGLVVSDVLTDQRALNDYLKDLLEGTYAEAVVIDGLLTVIPRGMQAVNANGAAYAPRTPAFTLSADDFLPNTNGSGGATSSGSSALNNDAVIWTVTRRSEAYNQVTVNCLDRSNAYNPNPQPAQAQAEIDEYGLVPADVKSYNFFALTSAALMSAHYQLEKAQIILTATFTLGMKYAQVTPMDLLSGVPVPGGVGTVTVNVIEKTENTADMTFTIVAELYPDIPLALPVYSHEPASGYIPNLNAPGGPVNTPVIFEPPPGLLAMGSDNNPQVWVGASGGPNWGGADVLLSVDGATYEKIGTITSPARQGVLLTALAAGADPDTAHTLSVDLGESYGNLNGGTEADADAARTLCYVDGEFISYSNATLEAGDGYSYELGVYLRRGQFGSAIAAHAAGSQFCRLDDRIFKYDLPLTPISYVGKTLYLKFRSFNTYGAGLEAEASCEAYAYTPGGGGALVEPPSAVAISLGYDRQPDGTIVPYMVISWTASPDPLFDQYEVQYRLHTGPGAWNSEIIGANSTSFEVKPVPVNTAFDAQVRAIRSAGPAGGPFYSAWAQDLNVVTRGKTAAPPAPTGLSVVGGYRQITVDWTASAENDIAWYEIWESADSNLAHATRIGLLNGTHYVRPGLNLTDTRYYWIRAEDTSGNFSAYLGPGVATTYGVDSSDIIGQIAGSQIAANSLAASSLISGLNVVQVVSTISAAVPATSNVAYAIDTAKLYRWNGAAWTTAVAGSDIVANSITASQVALGTLTAAQIQAGGITGDRIAANTITASNMAANSVTAASILAGTITGDKIAANFFQGYSFTASSGGAGYIQLYGGQYTAGSLTYGPYIACVDPSGRVRGVFGHFQGADGLWVYDASGNVIFEASQLGTGVVETVNVKAGNIVAQGFATVPFGTYTGGTGYQLIAAFNIVLYDTATVLVFANIQHGISVSGYAALQIQVDGAMLTSADISESTGVISGGVTLAGNAAGIAHSVYFYWAGSVPGFNVNGGSLIAFAGQR